MTTTRDHIIDLFRLLETAGYATPWRNLEGEAALEQARNLVTVWMAVLDGIPPEELQRGVMRFLRSSETFWPKPGQIREQCCRSGIALPTAAETFEWALQVIGAKGFRAANLVERSAEAFGPASAAPLTRALRAVGGTRALGTAPIAGDAVARAVVLKRWREAWEDAAEALALEGAEWPSSIPALVGDDERRLLQ